MTPHKLQVKLYLAGDTPDLDPLIPVFHRWIRESSVDEMLIDVADYRHVEDGPGVMLIGHQADYNLDFADGRAGLAYTRKREGTASLAELAALAVRQAVRAARLLETDEGLDGAFDFRTDTFELTILDRLRAPNRPESVAPVRATLQPVLADLFGGRAVAIDRTDNDPREPLSFQVRVDRAEPLAELAERLQTEAVHVAG